MIDLCATISSILNINTLTERALLKSPHMKPSSIEDRKCMAHKINHKLGILGCITTVPT